MQRASQFALTFAAILACLLLAAGPASAKPRPSNYVQLKAGGYFPDASDLDGFDAGGNVELALGHYVAPGFIIEGGVGYFETKGDFSVPGLGSATEKFKVVPLTLSLKGQTFFGQFEPYAEAGVGVYFIQDEIGGTILGSSASGSENDTQVGFFLGLGGNYNLTPQLFLGVEGRYLWVQTDTYGVDLHLDGIVLTVNLGYRF